MDEATSRPSGLPRWYSPHSEIVRDALAAARESDPAHHVSLPLGSGRINRLMLELRFAIDADELPPLLLLPR
jgi:hypothetical protein